MELFGIGDISWDIRLGDGTGVDIKDKCWGGETFGVDGVGEGGMGDSLHVLMMFLHQDL